MVPSSGPDLVPERMCGSERECIGMRATTNYAIFQVEWIKGKWDHGMID